MISTIKYFLGNTPIAGELLHPGLYKIAYDIGHINVAKEKIAEFLKKEYSEHATEYDKAGFPVNGDYGLLYIKWKNYLNESLMYQPRRILKSGRII